MALETVTPLTGKAEGVDMISSAWRHAAAHEPWDSGAVIVVARNSEGKDWASPTSTRTLAVPATIRWTLSHWKVTPCPRNSMSTETKSVSTPAGFCFWTS